MSELSSEKKRYHFSTQHLWSAFHFARLSAAIERAGDAERDGEHDAFVTGAVFTAVAFLEATINELFADVHDRFWQADHVKQLGPAAEPMGRLWEIPQTARYSVLQKFEVAVILAGKWPFDRGAAPYQHVALLVRLRNALMHYKPEWMVTSSPDPTEVTVHKLEKDLQGKFAENPLVLSGEPFFPRRCLSHGCAKWAVESSIAFARIFYMKMGLTPTFVHLGDLKSE